MTAEGSKKVVRWLDGVGLVKMEVLLDEKEVSKNADEVRKKFDELFKKVEENWGENFELGDYVAEMFTFDDEDGIYINIDMMNIEDRVEPEGFEIILKRGDNEGKFRRFEGDWWKRKYFDTARVSIDEFGEIVELFNTLKHVLEKVCLNDRERKLILKEFYNNFDIKDPASALIKAVETLKKEREGGEGA